MTTNTASKIDPIAIRQRRSLGLALTLFLFAVYLLVYRGGFHSVDEVSMFAVTESLVKFGRVNTDQIAWTQWTTSQAEAQGFFGADGHVYSKKGLALSLAQAPLYGLALVTSGLGMLQTVSLLNAGVTALTGLFIFMFLWRLGYAAPVSAATALIFGLATIAFVYAKYLFSEPLAGLLLLLAAYMLLAYRQEGGLRHVVIAGLAAGFAVLARANNLFLLPVFGLYLLWVASERISESADQRQAQNGWHLQAWSSFIHHPSSLINPVAAFLLSLAIPGAILLSYNAARSGNPLQTGYDLTLFTPNILLGLYKLLFSPLRGFFVYSPVLLLSLPGWWALRRRYPAEAWLFAGLAGVTAALFSAWSSGEGLSWGSRFLVPVTPFFALCLAPIIDFGFWIDDLCPPGYLRKTKIVLRFIFYVLAPLSLLIQLLGAIINPWAFLSQLQADFGGEFFLENTAALYNPRYSQIWGQLQSFGVANSDLVWWQPAGFDAVACGLSLLLVLLTGWFLWQILAKPPSRQAAKLPANAQPATRNTHYVLRLTPSLPTLIVLTVVTAGITVFLLTRYYRTDRQFGPPDDSYTAALADIAAADPARAPIITVAQYHYHVPMNRFKARVPLIGLAQQTPPLPETALPLLAAATTADTTWLVTLGFAPAAPDNAAEQWLAQNTAKIGDDWRDDSVRLVTFTAAVPAEERAVSATFDDLIRLDGLRTNPTARPAAPLPVELRWQALAQPPADLTTFVQLLNIDGQVVAQTNSPPQGGYAPTSGWQPGQMVTSRHGLPLPPANQLPPGDYRLIAGWFNPATGQRLPTNSGPDFVDLGVVTIGNEQ